MIIVMRTLWLVEDWIISCYNHPERGDYNTEALIIRLAAVWYFLMFLKKKQVKWKKTQLLW